MPATGSAPTLLVDFFHHSPTSTQRGLRGSRSSGGLLSGAEEFDEAGCQRNWIGMGEHERDLVLELDAHLALVWLFDAFSSRRACSRFQTPTTFRYTQPETAP
jgi:hypothetical protein